MRHKGSMSSTPDLSLAKKNKLEPETSLDEELRKTYQWMKDVLS